MIVTIHQPNYIPWLGLFHKIIQADIFIALDDVQFSKGDWYNRNRIKNCTGWQYLTVPVLQKKDQLIKDIQINETIDWKRKHLQAIDNNYRVCEFFDEVYELIQDILFNTKAPLSFRNVYFIDKVLHKMGYFPRIFLSSETLVEYTNSTDRLLNLTKAVGGTTYLAGPSAPKYFIPKIFEDNNVEVIYHKFECPEYIQRYPPFIANLSIIDVLMNLGFQGTKQLLELKENIHE